MIWMLFLTQQDIFEQHNFYIARFKHKTCTLYLLRKRLVALSHSQTLDTCMIKHMIIHKSHILCCFHKQYSFVAINIYVQREITHNIKCSFHRTCFYQPCKLFESEKVIWHKPFPKYDRLIECCLASSGEQFSSINNESKMTTDVNKRMGLKKTKKKNGVGIFGGLCQLSLSCKRTKMQNPNRLLVI